LFQTQFFGHVADFDKSFRREFPTLVQLLYIVRQRNAGLDDFWIFQDSANRTQPTQGLKLKHKDF
jgi:hypothetical protein